MIIIKDTSGRIIKEVHVNDDLNLIIRLDQDTELQQAKKEIERLADAYFKLDDISTSHSYEQYCKLQEAEKEIQRLKNALSKFINRKS